MVRHVLKDGRQVSDMTGHIVTVSEGGPVYKLMEEINEKDDKDNRFRSDNSGLDRSVRDGRRLRLSDDQLVDVGA